MKIANGLLALTLLGVTSCGSADSDQTRQPSEAEIGAYLLSQAKIEVKNKLRDPNSAVFSDVHLTNGALRAACGKVNSKNGFGGRTGAQPFHLRRYARFDLPRRGDVDQGYGRNVGAALLTP